MLLVGIHREDDLADVEKLATKIANLRLFNDVAGKINLSILEVMESRPASILAISNFTVYGDVAKNRRPSFVDSAPFERGKELFDLLLLGLAATGVPVDTGVFGADMQVSLVNDGPVTVIVDTR